MALNLEKHKESMVAAWSEVVDDKSPTNWALFGYEGQTNCLKLISKGDGGLVEMAEDFNSGSIMYAFCQVQDPKTTLPKYVLINWQGEGAPVVRKGTCANHIRSVCDFLKGIHVTINARTEEDVDPKLVIEKVCKSTGSAYNFKERSNLSNSNNSGPVGTVYQRVNPGQEINSKERDRFWEREEQEEKVRQEAERKRREEERKKQEEELRKRELVESAERDKRDSELTVKRQIARSAEKVSSCVEQTDMNGELDDREREERERRERSEVLRRQRSEEAQSLIAKRTINARAIFEKNTSAGQLSSLGRRASFQPSSDTSKVKNGIPSPETVIPPQNVNRKSSLPSWPPAQMAVPSQPTEQPIAEVVSVDETVQQTEEIPAETSVPSSEDDRDWESEDSQTGTIVRKSHKKSTDISEETVDPKLTKETTVQTTVQPTIVQETDSVFLNGGSSALDDDDDDDEDGDLGLKARALYDYQAADNTEITFYPGDIITHIEQIDEGWWQGFSPDGTFGLFPANYVELLD